MTLPVGDDLYPNDGADFDGMLYPDTEPKVSEEEKVETANMAASYPVLADINEWFEQQIAECDSLDNIQIEAIEIKGVKVNKTISIEAQLYALQLLKGLLKDKQEEFKDFKKDEE